MYLGKILPSLVLSGLVKSLVILLPYANSHSLFVFISAKHIIGMWSCWNHICTLGPNPQLVISKPIISVAWVKPPMLHSKDGCWWMCNPHWKCWCDDDWYHTGILPVNFFWLQLYHVFLLCGILSGSFAPVTLVEWDSSNSATSWSDAWMSILNKPTRFPVFLLAVFAFLTLFYFSCPFSTEFVLFLHSAAVCHGALRFLPSFRSLWVELLAFQDLQVGIIFLLAHLKLFGFSWTCRSVKQANTLLNFKDYSSQLPVSCLKVSKASWLKKPDSNNNSPRYQMLRIKGKEG